MSEAFDPDAFLAATSAKDVSFDPDAFLAEKAPTRTKPQVGAGETFLNKAGEALPAGRPLSMALATLFGQGAKALGVGSPGARLTPQAQAELDAGAGDIAPAERTALRAGPRNALPGVLEMYRQLRDRAAERTAAGEEQNRLAGKAGTVFGTGLSIAAPFLPKASAGSGAAGRILSNALTGAGYGVVNGATNGRADLTKGEVGQFLKDAAGSEGLTQAAEDAKAGKYGRAALDVASSGGIGGGLTGGALGAVGEGVRAAARPLAESIKAGALSQGRRALLSGADSLSRRTPVADAAVEEAIRSGAMPAFSNTKGILKRLGGVVEEADQQRQSIIGALEAKGVKGPDARAVADQLVTKGAAVERNTLNNALPAKYLEQADNLLGKAGPNGELGLTQAEKLKGSAQDLAKYGKFEETPLNEVNRDIAATIRQANEDAIAKAAQASSGDTELQALNSQFVPAKQRLGNLLQAEEAATRGASREANRGHFGLKQTMHGAAAIASGHGLLAAPLAMGSHFLQTRAPSAVANYGLSLADILRGAPQVTAPASGKLMELLSGALGPRPSMTPAMAEKPKQQRLQALAEALRGDNQ